MTKRRITKRGTRFIANFEGYLPRPYWDSYGGVWTVGYGSTVKPNGSPVSQYSPVYLPKWRARRWLRNTAQHMIGDWINANTRVGLNKNEFDALCSLGYNIGPGALASSTCWRELQAGNRRAAADAILMWDKAGGVTLLGLTRRRRQERALFLKDPGR